MKRGAKRICVVGAGSSGLAAIKSCKEEDLDVICYERNTQLGGLWNYHSDDLDDQPSVMKTTIINTSKEMSAFSDFPPPKDFANFMHNTHMLKYFQMYAENFDLVKHIKFRHAVENIKKAVDYDITGQWKVTVIDLNNDIKEEEVFDGVMICAGHHIYAHKPDFQGIEEFEGKVIHTHSLKSNEGFKDKTVLVIGIGNSAVDAAVELCQASKKLYLSTRTGSWIASRVGLRGQPFDIQVQRRIFYLIRRWDFIGLTDKIIEFFLNFKFNHKLYGLKPKHKPLEAHPTINDRLPNCILSGEVVIKQDVLRFTKHGVIFKGEDAVTEIDTVILATGYKIRYPFISEDILQVHDNYVNLYRFVFPPNLPHPTLAFIALVQPLGSMFPIAEAQSRWFVQLVLGYTSLPSQQEMVNEISIRRKKLNDIYVPSPRHTIQVLFVSYMDDICSQFGAKPNMFNLLFTDPFLWWECLFGSCVPYQYRLNGPHPWYGARDAILTATDRVSAPLNTRKFNQEDDKKYL